MNKVYYLEADLRPLHLIVPRGTFLSALIELLADAKLVKYCVEYLVRRGLPDNFS